MEYAQYFPFCRNRVRWFATVAGPWHYLLAYWIRGDRMWERCPGDWNVLLSQIQIGGITHKHEDKWRTCLYETQLVISHYTIVICSYISYNPTRLQLYPTRERRWEAPGGFKGGCVHFPIQLRMQPCTPVFSLLKNYFNHGTIST